MAVIDGLEYKLTHSGPATMPSFSSHLLVMDKAAGVLLNVKSDGEIIGSHDSKMMAYVMAYSRIVQLESEVKYLRPAVEALAADLGITGE